MRQIMTDFLAVLVAISMLGVACAGSVDAPDYTDDARYKSFRGRLYVKAVGIDVALYRINSQEMCDRQDAACIFDLYGQDTLLIADHVNQAFGPLLDVTVGMDAAIHPPDGDIIRLKCVEVFDGWNFGQGILDDDKKDARRGKDFLMYTCIKKGENAVRVCLWDVVGGDDDGTGHAD